MASHSPPRPARSCTRPPVAHAGALPVPGVELSGSLPRAAPWRSLSPLPHCCGPPTAVSPLPCPGAVVDMAVAGPGRRVLVWAAFARARLPTNRSAVALRLLVCPHPALLEVTLAGACVASSRRLPPLYLQACIVVAAGDRPALVSGLLGASASVGTSLTGVTVDLVNTPALGGNAGVVAAVLPWLLAGIMVLWGGKGGRGGRGADLAAASFKGEELAGGRGGGGWRRHVAGGGRRMCVLRRSCSSYAPWRRLSRRHFRHRPPFRLLRMAVLTAPRAPRHHRQERRHLTSAVPPPSLAATHDAVARPGGVAVDEAVSPPPPPTLVVRPWRCSPSTLPSATCAPPARWPRRRLRAGPPPEGPADGHPLRCPGAGSVARRRGKPHSVVPRALADAREGD